MKRALIIGAVVLAAGAVVYGCLTWLVVFSVRGIWGVELPFWPVFAGLFTLYALFGTVRRIEK